MSEAGMSIARSQQLDYQNRLFGLSEYNIAASSAVEGLPDEQRSSPVRRTFLLWIVFELVLSFILWLIYVKTEGDFIHEMEIEVSHYSFNSSLFDTQVLSAGRFIWLEVAYGAFLVSYRWPSVLSTTITTVFIIAKCFFFEFKSHPVSSGLSYAIVVFAMVMAWVSTVFLECRVLPQERIADQVSRNLSRFNPIFDDISGGREPALYNSTQQWATRTRTYCTASIYGSPEGSMVGDDTESLLGEQKLGSYGATDAPFDVAALLSQAEKLRKNAWKVYDSEVWDCGVDKLSYCPSLSSETLSQIPPQISSANLPDYKQKLFRLEGYINAPANTVFNDMVHGVEQTAHWNPTVSSAKYIQKFQLENLDIVRTVAKDVLGGLIKSRDFVILRAWGQERGMLYIASTSVVHPKCPPSADSIRAEQLINTIMLQSVGKSCKFIWVTSIDIKGWFPSNVVDRGISSSLMSFFKAVQSRASTLYFDVRQSSSTLNEIC